MQPYRNINETLCCRRTATERPARDDLEAATAACSFLRKRGLDDERAVSVPRQVAAGPDLESASPPSVR
jgi:hypothetical protein